MEGREEEGVSRDKSAKNDGPELPGLLARVRDKMGGLSGEQRDLAEYIMLNYDSAGKLSLVQLAESAGVSPSTVVDFCDQVGCEGFHALHTALAEIDSIAASVFFEQIDTLNLQHTVTSVFGNITRVLQHTLETLDMATMQRAVDAISSARRIQVIGLGTSGSIAQEFAFRLAWIGMDCFQEADPHQQLMAAALLAKGDVAIAVTHSGRTRSVVSTLQVGRERGATTICITDFPHSPITEQADICISGAYDETSLGVEMVATRAAHLALVDAITMCVALRNRERTIESIKRNERLLVNLRY